MLYKVILLSVLLTVSSCTIKPSDPGIPDRSIYPGVLYVFHLLPLKTELNKVETTILAGYLWLYFILYLFISCACVWYSQRTGKIDNTLLAIREAVGKRFNWKFNLLYKILLLFHRRKK